MNNTNREIKICPVCKKEYDDYPALSRRDNKTEICPLCGIKEALEDFYQSAIRQDDSQ